MNYVLDLYDYHVWANRRIFERLKQLPQDAFRHEVQSVFPTVSKALAHIYAVDATWLDILQGTSMRDAMESGLRLAVEAEAASLFGLETMFDALAKRGKIALNGQADLDEKLLLDNPYAGVRETSKTEMVLHFVTHGNYHRGNISAMLHQAGHSSAMQDYGLYWYAK